MFLLTELEAELNKISYGIAGDEKGRSCCYASNHFCGLRTEETQHLLTLTGKMLFQEAQKALE